MGRKSTTRVKPDAHHGIAVVARRTGLTQLVLRAWERRYGAVHPARTDTGRRLYTDEDITRLTLLGTLTGAGHRIGDIAPLSLDDLRTLAGEITASGSKTAASTARPPRAAALLDQAMAAIADMNQRVLLEILDEASLTLSKPMLRNDLIVPMLDGIGERWHDGDLRVAHEHMASAVVKTFLLAMNARHVPPPGAPILVVATPSKHIHELGALLVASLAQDLGWDVLNLGADLPAEEIVMGVRRRGARALYLGLIYPLADATVAEQLLTIRKLAGHDLPILVSGQAAESYTEVLTRVDARIMDTPDTLEQHLTALLNS